MRQTKTLFGSVRGILSTYQRGCIVSRFQIIGELVAAGFYCEEVVSYVDEMLRNLAMVGFLVPMRAGWYTVIRDIPRRYSEEDLRTDVKRGMYYG